MGDVLHISCEGCDLDDSYYVGSGMAMISYELYVCERCRDLVEFEYDARDPDSDTEPSSCGECDGPVVPLFQAAANPDPEDWDHPCRDVVCPRCQRTLRIERVGLWD